MAVAMRNTQNSTSMLQTAEGSLDEASNVLIRMKDLATQAADASSSVADKEAMQLEFNALGEELGNVMNNTTFGGALLLNGGTLAAAMDFQIGAADTEVMSVDLSTDLTAVDTAISGASAAYAAPGTGTEIETAAGATTALGELSTALDAVGKLRSGLGASANRLEHVYNNLANISTNSKAAMGRIMDVDFASESSKMTSNQMLMQAGTAMLKQSNSMSSMVMSLLQ
jgi:flagellin